MIKNIIFDMGNVILTYDPMLVLQVYAPEANDIPVLRREIQESKEWQQLDQGTITYEQAQQQILSRLPQRLHSAAVQILERWQDYMLPLQESLQLVRELKELGYGIYLLSNASVRFHEYEQKVEAFRYFDGKLISADVLLLKPQREIYEKLFETFQLNPEECFFIDDMEANVQGSIAAGMPAYQYDGNMEKLRLALAAQGIPVRTENTLEFLPVTTQEQREELAALAHEIWNQHFVPIIGQAQVDYMLEQFQSYPALTRQIQQDGYEYYFFHYNGENVGYVGIHPEADRLFLSKLYLKRAYRGRRLASQAFDFLCQYCKERGLSKIWLTVNKDNANTIQVYKNVGFTVVKAQVASIGNGFVMDDYVMEKEVL
ncbi:MAG: GNAT family N-acetyltransferase [Massiliimalia sp.]|jgi:HAD superfamily hydrolase (TIGR01509 family)